MSWKTVALGDICEFTRGLTYSKIDEVEFSNNAVLRATNIDLESNKLNLEEIRYINNSVKINEDKKVKLNDILICTASGSKSHLGKVALINEQLDMAFGGFMAVLRVKKNIEAKFLFNYLTSDIFLNHISKLADGANINNLKFSQIQNLKINLPPLATQQKIVAKLDAIFAEIDTAMAAAETNAKNAEVLFQSYLTDVFERGGEDWKTFTIKDLIKIRSGDFLPAKNMKVDGNIDVYGGNGISGKHNLHNISGENIVIGRVGAKCGNVRLVNGDIWITDNAFYVSEYKIKLNKEFLALALKQKNLRELAHQMAQPVISFATIKDAEIKIPSSISAQIKLLEVKNFLESQIEIVYTANVKKIKLFNLLKQSILQQAFNGELIKAA